MLIFLSKRGVRRFVMSAVPSLVILAAAAWFWHRWAGWAPGLDPWAARRSGPSVGRDLPSEWDVTALAGSTPLYAEEQRRIRADLTGDGEPETVRIEAVYTDEYRGRRLGYYRIKVDNGDRAAPEAPAPGGGAPGGRGRGAAAATYVLESPIWEREAGVRADADGGDGAVRVPREMLAGAYGAPFSVKAVDLTGDGLRELLVLGKAGQKNTPFYIFRWDGESYVPVLSEQFWGNPRLVDFDRDGTLEVEGYERLVSESVLLKRYGFRGDRWVQLSADPNLGGMGGELVQAVLDGVSEAFLGIPLPNPTRWFAEEWIADPNGWMAWRILTESWVAVQVADVAFVTPETNERVGTWQMLGWAYEALGSGGAIERIPILLTFETVREAGEWRIREIRREDPQDGL